ncbi:hypothetical protein YH65_06185 [Sulfurovum lithotrophicum]|uniref:Uncharacterized protein n=1 Tax=Sulfurovum lithotrophicum TaxID=206403 RepID=A0A7U4M1C4_9BACT|nr:hypothetical protein [Sulfurovum lithotrophicum]AKF25025.1 hypothetical protein YH65_06185 [Sulfurovum lithotrophicum]
MQKLIIENIHETYNYTLLKQVYEEILVSCFPDPEDHLNWKTMKRMAKRGLEDETANERVLISVSKQIREDGMVFPVAFFVGVYYRRSRTGLISYMGMRDGCRGFSASNIQKQVLIEMKKEAAKEKEELRAVLSLVDLPEHADPRYITLPPTQRIIIMERNGASYIPINFHYPMFKNSLLSFISPKITYKYDAALLGYKLHGKLTTESPEAIKDFIDDFYESYGLDPKCDPMVEKMKREIDFIPHGIDIKLSKRYRLKEKEKRIQNSRIVAAVCSA